LVNKSPNLVLFVAQCQQANGHFHVGFIQKSIVLQDKKWRAVSQLGTTNVTQTAIWLWG
jgi:hypothetical protein